METKWTVRPQRRASRSKIRIRDAGTRQSQASSPQFSKSYWVSFEKTLSFGLFSATPALVKIHSGPSTVWPEWIWIKVKKSQLSLPQHQSTYPRGPESELIEIPPFRPHFINFSKTDFYEVNLVSQRSHLEELLLSKFGSERGDFNWCRFWASWVCTLILR